MGFLANAWNYGWTAGSIITKAEREADRICKDIKTTIIESPEGEDESDGNEASGCKIIFHPEIFRQLMGYDRKDQKENDNYTPEVIGSNFDANEVSENGVAYAPKVCDGRFDALEIKRNIAAAINHLGIGDGRDINIIRTQIAAILYTAGLTDTDMIFEALNKDCTAYATVNERVRTYSGEPMDEKLIKMDIDKDIDAEVVEKLRLLTDWELKYLTERMGCSDKDDLPGNILEGYGNVMNYLDEQIKGNSR